MKTLLLIVTAAALLIVPGNSLGAKYGNADAMQNPEPAPAADLFAVSPADKEKLQILLRQLDDSDPFVRVEAVQGLGEIHGTESLVSVCGCLDDENIYVRAYAAEALGKIGRLDISLTLSKLLPALDDPSPYVRSMMILALGELQDERAVDPIREFLNDEDESVRGMAAWALNNIENGR